MRLGIYTRYFRHEATYAATRVGNYAQLRGCDVSMFTDDRQHTDVCRAWDSRVVRSGPHGFTEWARQQDLIFWTHTPPEGQISWAKKAGKRTAVLAMWQEFISQDRKSLKHADMVLCPASPVTEMLRKRWKLSNCMTVHWDTGMPIVTRHDRSPVTRPRVLLPTDLLHPKFSPEMFALLEQLFETCPDVQLTLSYVPSRWRNGEASMLHRLRRFSQLQLVPSVYEEDRPLLFQRHDLVLWPCVRDNFAYGAIYALTVGVPVLAFASPITHGLFAKTDSLTVPTDVAVSDLGVSRVLPDYPAYLQFLLGIVLDPGMLPAMQSTDATYLTNRRNAFTSQWDGILGV